MAITTTSKLGLRYPSATGQEVGTWGTAVGAGFEDADDRFQKTGSGDPNIGAVVVDFIGQPYFDTSSELWWVGTAVGTPPTGTWVEDITITKLGAVENKGGVPSIQAGVAASRPAFGIAGQIYISTDTQVIERDNGSGWDLLPVPPTFTAQHDQVSAGALVSWMTAEVTDFDAIGSDASVTIAATGDYYLEVFAALACRAEDSAWNLSEVEVRAKLSEKVGAGGFATVMNGYDTVSINSSADVDKFYIPFYYMRFTAAAGETYQYRLEGQFEVSGAAPADIDRLAASIDVVVRPKSI